jgi:RpiB/LacA/LacB family sugar-phosphate isomerase
MNKKATLLVPIAGKGQRFIDEGYHMPKPLIMVDGEHIIDWSFKSINVNEYDIIFVVRDEHIHNFGIDSILRDKFGKDIKIVSTDKITSGTVASCLLAEKYIDHTLPLVIYTLDVYFEPKFSLETVDDCDGLILTFKANNKSYSYAQLDESGLVKRTAEKEIISEHAAVGIYYFKHGSDFILHAHEMISKNLRTNNEFYVCPLYNLMISSGKKIKTAQVDKMYLMGTPAELNFFKNTINKKFGQKPIALSADHSGFHLKEIAKKLLDERNIKYIDFGTYVKKDCDYNDYIEQAATFIRNGECDFGFAFCRSGQGVNICANKQKGIRSALISDEFSAEMAVRHNCANFFTFSERITDEVSMGKLIDIIKSNTFDGGRHITRVQKLENEI